jgi:hypothetical protein
VQFRNDTDLPPLQENKSRAYECPNTQSDKEEKSDSKLQASGRIKYPWRIVEAQSCTFLRMIDRAVRNGRRLNSKSRRRERDSVDIGCRLHNGRVY